MKKIENYLELGTFVSSFCPVFRVTCALALDLPRIFLFEADWLGKTGLGVRFWPELVRIGGSLWWVVRVVGGLGPLK